MHRSESRLPYLLFASFVAASCSDTREGWNEGGKETGPGIGGNDGGVGDDGGSDDSGDDGEKFDVAAFDGGGGSGGDCGPENEGDEYDFSLIWIANSTEGTVSKIDTVTATELARYRTGPTTESDPSRTSVNLVGDVAVANRSGSVTKFAAREKKCVDRNGDGTIQTSTGPGDVLEWMEDECMLWHHDVGFTPGEVANEGGPRAIAWDAGELDEDICHRRPNVWVGWRAFPENTTILRRLVGETGQLDAEVSVPDWQGNWGHGTYGGATNRDGDFWGLGTLGTLVRVDAEDLTVERFDNPGSPVLYGIALDQHGMPWLVEQVHGHIWRFDTTTEQFQDRGPTGASTMRGLAIDENGHAWIAANSPCALVQFDTLAGGVIDSAIDLPGCQEPVGVSIDVEGNVWVVDRQAERAFKVDPATYAVVVVDGLVDPYTYSDMTGAGLGLVVNPPQG